MFSSRANSITLCEYDLHGLNIPNALAGVTAGSVGQWSYVKSNTPGAIILSLHVTDILCKN